MFGPKQQPTGNTLFGFVLMVCYVGTLHFGAFFLSVASFMMEEFTDGKSLQAVIM